MRDGIWRANLFLHGKLDVAKIPEMHNFLQKKHGVRATFYLYK